MKSKLFEESLKSNGVLKGNNKDSTVRSTSDKNPSSAHKKSAKILQYNKKDNFTKNVAPQEYFFFDKSKNVAQGKWTLEKVRTGILSFHKEYNRYPTAHDFDMYPKLPSARHIQRKFNGLLGLRKSLNLKEKDFTKGVHSRTRARHIEARQRNLTNGIYNLLLKKLPKSSIVRDFSLTDDTRSKIDFRLSNEAQNCAVDVFYSKDDRILIGCINSKQEKYSGDNYLKDPVIFLSTNKDIGQERINQLIERKKKPLKNNQYILAWESFEKFLNEFSRNKKIENILSTQK